MKYEPPISPEQIEINKLRSELDAAQARIRALEDSRAIVSRLLVTGGARPIEDRRP